MTQAQQPEAIKLASEYRETMPADVLHLWAGEVVGALRRLHEEAVDLRVLATSLLNKNGGLQLAVWTAQEANSTLQARVQELEAELVKEAGRTASEKLRADQMSSQHTMQCSMRRELEAQLESIGAGGVEPLRRDHFRDATEMVPVGWAISYDGKTPHALWTEGDGDLLDLEVKRQGGTACKMALYAIFPHHAASAAPLTDSAIQAARTSDYGAEDAPESWAFTLGVRFAERAHGITQEQQ